MRKFFRKAMELKDGLDVKVYTDFPKEYKIEEGNSGPK